jgi:ABC-type transporter Mla subunit MlaD
VRRFLGIAAVILVVVALGAILFLAREEEDTYQVRAIFDNAGFVPASGSGRSPRST